MENNYGIGIANRFSLFYDQDDVTDNFETVVSKKKKDKKEVPATATTNPVVGVKATTVGAEKENKSQSKVSGATGQQKPQEPRKDQRKGIKEQNTARKDNGELHFERFYRDFQEFSQKMCSRRYIHKVFFHCACIGVFWVLYL